MTRVRFVLFSVFVCAQLLSASKVTLRLNCCAEVALPDVPVLMRREDEETAVCTDKGKKERENLCFYFL